MFYIPIQKDFSRVKTKVAFGLTKRQIICFVCAACIGIPSFLLLKRVIASDIAGIIMVLEMLPFFMLALYEKNGMPLEEIAKNWFTEKYIRPQIRPVVNEPVLMGVMQIADYIDEQERMEKENRENSITKVFVKKKGKLEE